MILKMICQFPGCDRIVIDKTIGLCQNCIYKISRFEERLDRWLSNFHKDLALEDVMGWYCKCVSEKCTRCCLEESFYFPGCECCPCNLQLQYIPERINNSIYPYPDWIDKLQSKIEK